MEITYFAFLKYPPFIIFSLAGVSLIGLYAYYKLYKKQESVNKKLLTYIAWAIIGFRVIFSIFLAVVQYFTWKKDSFAQYFLPPNRPIGYFLQYAWTHYFLGAILSIIAAFVFYFILMAVKKHRAEIFEEGELELGLACGLIIGWPNVILFVALAFLLLLVLSILRQLFFKEQFTTITLPLLISLPIIFILGRWLIDLLKLSALRI